MLITASAALGPDILITATPHLPCPEKLNFEKKKKIYIYIYMYIYVCVCKYKIIANKTVKMVLMN
jgi:hypothetical protein